MVYEVGYRTDLNADKPSQAHNKNVDRCASQEPSTDTRPKPIVHYNSSFAPHIEPSLINDVIASACFVGQVWVAGNDATGFGVADDWLIPILASLGIAAASKSHFFKDMQLPTIDFRTNTDNHKQFMIPGYGVLNAPQEGYLNIQVNDNTTFVPSMPNLDGWNTIANIPPILPGLRGTGQTATPASTFSPIGTETFPEADSGIIPNVVISKKNSVILVDYIKKNYIDTGILPKGTDVSAIEEGKGRHPTKIFVELPNKEANTKVPYGNGYEYNGIQCKKLSKEIISNLKRQAPEMIKE